MKWPFAKFSEVALPGKGAIVSGPFGSNIGSRFFVDEGVPVIRGNNLTFGERRFIDDGFVYLTEEKAREFKNCLAVAGDLVFTAAGTIGQVGIIPTDSRFDRYVISNKQLRVRCDQTKVRPLFLFLWFTTEYMRRYLINQNTGCSIPLINLGTLRNLPVPLPSLEVQERVASTITAYDDLIENNRRRMALLEEAARQVYREWFVRLRFPGHEHTPVINGVPDGWERKNVGQMLTLKRGYDLPESQRVEGDIPIVSSSGITGFHDEKKAVAPGIVTGRYGTIGEVFFIQGDYWPLNTALYVCDFKGNPPAFLAHFLKYALQGILSDKAAVPGVNRNVLHHLPVLSPPKLLIDQFAEFAHLTYQQIHTLECTNQKLRTARDLLLPRLMTGEIAV
jgi:type I restriction enzyme S subunit